MADIKIEIDNESIKKFGNNVKIESDKLTSIINDLLEETNKLNEYLDTPTGKIFQEKLIEYLNSQKELIQKEYLDYHNTINRITTIYDELDISIRESTGGKING